MANRKKRVWPTHQYVGSSPTCGWAGCELLRDDHLDIRTVVETLVTDPREDVWRPAQDLGSALGIWEEGRDPPDVAAIRARARLETARPAADGRFYGGYAQCVEDRRVLLAYLDRATRGAPIPTIDQREDD